MPDQHCTATRHGSTYAYQKYGCRCDNIVDRMREMWRQTPSRTYRPTGRRHGWSNRTDVDPIAVALVADDGHRLRLTAGERKAAVAELTRRGWMTHQIADRLGVTRRTVHRLKIAA
jgi:DNA-binding NarL/FixJ family response regulator